MIKGQTKLAGLVLSILMMVGLAGSAMAQNAVEGKYDASATGDAIGTITFQLTVTRDGEKWKAEVSNSPQPMSITKMTVDGDKISLTADTSGTEVTLTAQYANGKINGKWVAGDANGTWMATRQAGAAAGASAASAGGAASLEGAYDGEISVEGQGSLPLAFVVKKDGGKLAVENKGSGDISVNGIETTADGVTLTLAYQGQPFPISGKVNGGEMSGKWEAGGFSGTWKAKKK